MVIGNYNFNEHSKANTFKFYQKVNELTILRQNPPVSNGLSLPLNPGLLDTVDFFDQSDFEIGYAQLVLLVTFVAKHARLIEFLEYFLRAALLVERNADAVKNRIF